MKDTDNPNSGPPPFFKSWKQIYLLVLGFFVALVLLFSWLTNLYNFMDGMDGLAGKKKENNHQHRTQRPNFFKMPHSTLPV